MDKNFVSMGQKYCPICGKMFSDNTLLLDKRLRPSMEKYTCTGVELCEEHAKIVSSGEFVMFFVADETTGKRTGEGFMMKTAVALKTFNTAIAPINHCSVDVLEKLREMVICE